MEKKYISLYNTKESLIVISSYPRHNESHSQGVCAMAAFTKNLIQPFLEQDPTRPIIIFALTLHNEKEIIEEYPLLTIRCFSRNHPLSFLLLIRNIFLFSKVKNYLISFEFASFGDTAATACFLLPIWLLFFLRKHTTLILHQVLLDVKSLGPHIGIKNQQYILLFILNVCLRLYYKLLLIPQSHIIVLEASLKKKLLNILPQKNIQHIPLGVKKSIRVPQHHARQILGFGQQEIVLLYFGYLTWYKGVDFLVNTFHGKIDLKNRPVRLVVAGGASFTQSNKPHYQKFIADLVKKMGASPAITHRGFIPEEDIPLYFSAADLVVFPYRTLMSTSGPLSLALSFHKPFILSKDIQECLEEKNIRAILQENHLQASKLTFSLHRKSFLTTLESVLDNNLYTKLTTISQQIAQQRSTDILCPLYQSVFYDTKIPPNLLTVIPNYA